MSGFPARTFTVTRADLAAYAVVAGDPNPIHLEERIAVSVGLPGVVAHGMLTLALAARAVGEWTGGAEVLELGAKFTAPVVVPENGTTITVAGKRTDQQDGRSTIAMTVTCGDRKVLGNPRAVVRG